MQKFLLAVGIICGISTGITLFSGQPVVTAGIGTIITAAMFLFCMKLAINLASPDFFWRNREE